ncbi:MAG TPA: enoyl-CoA hydratase/isomerase family protein [Dehalococcoidia bacterium]|nr:enoyl-CoA hydratase/isomerase family protein [Dehalococcoidia bacterium]
MEYKALRVVVERPLARIVLAGGEGNRVGPRALRELAEACSALRDESEVRVVVLSAQGADFCLSWDIEAFGEGFELPPDPFGCLAALPQPVICAVQGVASSAGFELALCADVRLCSDDARFALPEVGQGMLPRGGGGQRLSRLAGRGVALAVLLAGEELDAAAALRAGVVSAVVPRAELADRTEAIARTIASRGPIATRYAKEAVHRGADMTLEQALRYETDLTIILQTTEDRAEGVRAFIEKREQPDFKGR